MVRVPNDQESAVLSFVREHDGGRPVFAVFNFCGEERTVAFGDGPQRGA